MAAKRALCIGINNYPGTDSDLSGCVNDAKDWKGELEKRGFEVTLILDKEASKMRMQSEIRNIVEATNGKDIALITYSGHGTWALDQDGDEADGRDEALCPYDIHTKGPLLDDEIYSMFLDRERGAKIVFISDSCHSGTVSRFSRFGAEDGKTKTRFMPPGAYINDEKKLLQFRRFESNPSKGRSRAGALLISGCKDNEYSYDAAFGNRPNGAFTYVALSVLSSLAKNATYAEWHKAIREELPSQEYPQTPCLVGGIYQKKWKIFE
jgi:metacaspase-1